MNEAYKFRISCKVSSSRKQEVSEFEFQYEQLSQARENYKAILLSLYRKKGVVGFAICLNRCRDRKWSRAIHRETVRERVGR